jgi:predicted DNA-binding protein (MmcQ/YjbR family)
VRVFSIAGKMFALQGLRGDSLAFKVDKDLFLGHCDRPGIHPAPYLARAQWIIMNTPYPLGAEELQGLRRVPSTGGEQIAQKRRSDCA